MRSGSHHDERLVDGNVALELHTFGVGSRPDDVERRIEDGDDVGRAAVEAGLAGGDSRDVEHVRDELRQHAGVPLDHFGRALLRRRVHPGRAQDARVAENRVERRPQFVREVGQKLFLRAIGCFELAQHALLFGDVAGDLGRADDPAVRRPDRGDRQRDVDEAAVLAHANGFVMVDAFAAANPRQDLVLLALPVRRNDAADRSADHFLGGVPEHALRRGIPGLNDAVQILADNGVVRRLDDRGEACRDPNVCGRVANRLHWGILTA